MLCNHHLTAFLQVAQAGSFAKAADALHISSTALIKQINLFENELKLVLLKRSAKGISLTEAGELIFKEGIAYALKGEEIVKRAQSLNERVFFIKIGSSPLTSGAFVAALYQKVQSEIPKVRMQLVPFVNEPRRAYEILHNLGDEVDIVLGVYDQKFLQSFNNEAFLLKNAPLCLALPHGHPWCGRRAINLSELSGTKVFLIRDGWMDSFSQARAILSDPKLNIELITFDFFDVEIFNRAENEGAPIVAISNFIEAHPLFTALPINWNLTAKFGIIHSKKPAFAVRQFFNALAEYYPQPQEQATLQVADLMQKFLVENKLGK